MFEVIGKGWSSIPLCFEGLGRFFGVQSRHQPDFGVSWAVLKGLAVSGLQQQGLCWYLALEELQAWLFCAWLGRAVGQEQMEGAVAGRGQGAAQLQGALG